MKNKLKVNIIVCGIIAAVALVITLAFLELNHYSAATSLADKYKIMADAFTYPGMLLILFGALIWVSSKGALDSIGFMLGRLFRSLIPGARHNPEDKESYYEYIQRKRAKQTKAYWPLIIVGGIYMLVAIVFIILFYKVY